MSRSTSSAVPSNLDVPNRWGKFFVSFLPAISAEAAEIDPSTDPQLEAGFHPGQPDSGGSCWTINPIVRG